VTLTLSEAEGEGESKDLRLLFQRATETLHIEFKTAGRLRPSEY
jgi:hypothetical protein